MANWETYRRLHPKMDASGATSGLKRTPVGQEVDRSWASPCNKKMNISWAKRYVAGPLWQGVRGKCEERLIIS